MASAGTQTIGSLVIDLRANVAQLRADMDDVKNTIAKSSREMSSQMKQDMNETRQVLALMRDDFGVGVPRELRKVIASSELARTAILGIKDALFGIAFLNIGIEAFSKITELINNANEALKKQRETERQLTESVEKTNADHAERLRLINLIGKSEQEKYESEKTHLETVLKIQRTKLAGLQEEFAYYQAFQKLNNQPVSEVTKMFAGGVALGLIEKQKREQQDATDAAKKQVADANKAYLEALDALSSFLANAEEKKRQDNKKTAEEQQKDLEQTIAKVKELQAKDVETLDPLTKARVEWEAIRATQALILAKHPDIQEHVTLIGTLTAEWRAEQKIITEETAKLPGELQKGLSVLREMQQLQGQQGVSGIIGSMSHGGAPQLKGDIQGAQFDNFTRDRVAQQALLKQSLKDLITPAQQFEEIQKEINFLMAQPNIQKDAQAMEALRKELIKANPEFQNLMAASSELGKDLSNELDQLILHGKSFGDVVKSLAKDIEELALKYLLLKPLEDFFSGKGGGSGGGITSFLGSIFSGLHFADGGSPPVGQLSLVGENGPELFMPSSAGTIIPNGALGGGVVNNFYIDAKGAAPGSEAAIVRGLKRALEQNRKASVASAIDYQRRR